MFKTVVYSIPALKKKSKKQYKQNRGNAFCLGAMSNCIGGSFFVPEMVDIRREFKIKRMMR
jgi:hypothetical protein